MRYLFYIVYYSFSTETFVRQFYVIHKIFFHHCCCCYYNYYYYYCCCCYLLFKFLNTVTV